MRYAIYQLKREYVTHSVDCYFDKYIPKRTHYDQTYVGKLNPEETRIEHLLDMIFKKLNGDYPEDYEGRSLSVSDMVEIKGQFYLCEPMGWSLVSF